MDFFKLGSNGFMDGVGPGHERHASPELRRKRRRRIASTAIPAYILVAMARHQRRKQQQKQQRAAEIGPGTTDHDMKGVYSTGIDEIVGQARAARARRGQGVSPMMSPVPGLVARKPRVEIIDMPEMRISRGSVSPAMPNISPQLAMLLRQIHGGTQTLRADGAAVRRQRPVWPGARGRYPY